MKIKIGSKKPSNPSRTTQLEIKVKVLEEQVKALVTSTNQLLDNNGLAIISIDESPEEKKLRSEKEKGTVRYGD